MRIAHQSPEALGEQQATHTHTHTRAHAHTSRTLACTPQHTAGLSLPVLQAVHAVRDATCALLGHAVRRRVLVRLPQHDEEESDEQHSETREAPMQHQPERALLHASRCTCCAGATTCHAVERPGLCPPVGSTAEYRPSRRTEAAEDRVCMPLCCVACAACCTAVIGSVAW